MTQNGLGEGFWDGLGVEIEACANFDPKTFFWGTEKFLGIGCSGSLGGRGADGHSGWPLVPPRAAPESAMGPHASAAANVLKR